MTGHGDPDRLADREALRELKARYFRCLDAKDWDGLRAVCTDDVVVEADGTRHHGARAFVDFLAPVLAGASTVHHGHTPEITFTGDDTASVVWAMADYLVFDEGPPPVGLHGYGHYHDRCVRTADGWRLAEVVLTRLRTDPLPGGLPTGAGAGAPRPLVLALDDLAWFVDQALDAMVAIVTSLGDDLANRRPDLPGANSPFAILTHCLGVMEFWGGRMVAGRPIQRDRDAEFTAQGPVGGLVEAVAAARRRFRHDLEAADALAPPRHPPAPGDAGTPLARTQGGVLLHVYEELSQHLGQMELTRDVLAAG